MNEHIRQLMLDAGFAAPELAGRAQNLVTHILASVFAETAELSKPPAAESMTWGEEVLANARAEGALDVEIRVKQKFGVK